MTYNKIQCQYQSIDGGA